MGLKLWTPPPSYNSAGFLGWAPATPSFFGHRSLVWLFAGAPFCYVVVQVAGVQVAIFHMAGFFFFDNVSNLWTLCCTKLSELVGSPVVKKLNCNSKDPLFEPWYCEVLVCHPLGMPNLGERLGFNLVHKKCSPQNYKRGGGSRCVKSRVGGSKVGWVGLVQNSPPPLTNEAWSALLYS